MNQRECVSERGKIRVWEDEGGGVSRENVCEWIGVRERKSL